MSTTATATAAATEPERWATIERAAVYIASSRATVYRLIARGLITSTHVGRRHLVDLHSVDRLLDPSAPLTAGPSRPSLSPDVPS